MDPVVLICIVLLTLCLSAFIIYSIFILVEIRKILIDSRETLKEFAKRVDKINKTIDNLTDLTDTVSKNLLFFTSGKFFLSNFQKLFSFFKKNKGE